MRDLIRKRLTEYREEAHQRIGKAVNMTKSRFSGAGRLDSGAYCLAINEDNKTGFVEYMDRSAAFIRHLAPGSSAEYAGELRDGGNKLKQAIITKMDLENSLERASPGDSELARLRSELGPALDRIIKRKVEDFKVEYVEGKSMNPTTNNTVNIIGSNISNSVLQITQSNKDTISKDTAQKLEQLVNSEEIKALPERERLNVLDQMDEVIRELKAPSTDKGKVHRGLERLGKFISSVGSKAAATVVAELAVAWAKANGLIP
jgi:hypothetical protein